MLAVCPLSATVLPAPQYGSHGPCSLGVHSGETDFGHVAGFCQCRGTVRLSDSQDQGSRAMTGGSETSFHRRGGQLRLWS